MTAKPITDELTVQTSNGKVSDMLCQGVLLANQSSINAVKVRAASKLVANPIPEMFNPWLGDNLASTEIPFTPHC
jgi:hypothetical protein